jgi:ribonuclease E
VVRTRTDVALYVLNHKRGHLRDLENSFKVTLAIVADSNVSAQQSFIIDRGEQVHTLEAAKALLADQVAAFPAQVEEVSDDDTAFDVETESEVETEETEGLAEAQPAGEDGEADGHRRKHRRRRRGRGGEARDGQPRDDNEVRSAAVDSVEGPVSEDTEKTGEDESEDQSGIPPAERQHPGERRPRRRGRRGGRRRRGELEDGPPASVSDEFAPGPSLEAEHPVANYEASEPVPVHAEPGSVAAPEPPRAEPARAEPVAAASEEHGTEAEKTGRRRSTVREKASFLSSPPSNGAPATVSPTEHPSPSPAPAETAAPSEQPRKAGWWSRRFGGGE